MGAFLALPRILREMQVSIRDMQVSMNEIKGRVNSLVELNSALLAPLNAYESMTQTTTRNQVNTMNIFCTEHGYDRGVCMLTGERGTIKLAHILPWSAHKKSQVMKMLQMTVEMLNNAGNLLLLAENIEMSFDRLQLSFEPQLAEGLQLKYVVRIWDDNIRDTPIFAGSPSTIGEYDGRFLTIHQHHQVFERLFAYQGLWATANAHENNYEGPPLQFRVDDLQGAPRRRFEALLQMKSAELMRALEAAGTVYGENNDV